MLSHCMNWKHDWGTSWMLKRIRSNQLKSLLLQVYVNALLAWEFANASDGLAKKAKVGKSLSLANLKVSDYYVVFAYNRKQQSYIEEHTFLRGTLMKPFFTKECSVCDACFENSKFVELGTFFWQILSFQLVDQRYRNWTGIFGKHRQWN